VDGQRTGVSDVGAAGSVVGLATANTKGTAVGPGDGGGGTGTKAVRATLGRGPMCPALASAVFKRAKMDVGGVVETEAETEAPITVVEPEALVAPGRAVGADVGMLPSGRDGVAGEAIPVDTSSVTRGTARCAAEALPGAIRGEDAGPVVVAHGVADARRAGVPSDDVRIGEHTGGCPGVGGALAVARGGQKVSASTEPPAQHGKTAPRAASV